MLGLPGGAVLDPQGRLYPFAQLSFRCSAYYALSRCHPLIWSQSSFVLTLEALFLLRTDYSGFVPSSLPQSPGLTTSGTVLPCDSRFPARWSTYCVGRLEAEARKCSYCWRRYVTVVSLPGAARFNLPHDFLECSNVPRTYRTIIQLCRSKYGRKAHNSNHSAVKL